jgi:hypothetical protein
LWQIPDSDSAAIIPILSLTLVQRLGDSHYKSRRRTAPAIPRLARRVLAGLFSQHQRQHRLIALDGIHTHGRYTGYTCIAVSPARQVERYPPARLAGFFMGMPCMAEIVYAGLTAVAIMIVVALALTAISIAWNAAESSPSNLDDELVSKKQVEAPESTNSTLAT